MYHNKKIGIFISHIMGFYQKNVCQGIIDKALEYGYTAEIFASMDGENLGDYSLGEESILTLPNFDNLSGVIFASETYPNEQLKDQIYSLLKEKCHCPIIEIAVYKQQFPSVSLENNHPFFDITEHLITEHHYKNICYFGCADESFFSDAREKFYRDALKKHGIAPHAHSIYTGTYTAQSAAEALRFFEENETKPDAVVCYNDKLALLLMTAAISAGYHIPEDLAITGCDHSEEGQNLTPSLTTVSFPVYELGEASVEKLMKLIHEENVPAITVVHAQMVLENSCGCSLTKETPAIYFEQKLTSQIASLESSILSSMKMSAEFQNIADIDEAMDLLENYVHSIPNCSEFYLCLYANWDSVSQHILELTENEMDFEPSQDEIILKLSLRDGKRLPECSFTKRSLLPEHIYRQSDSAYLYFPLFFKNKTFGYIALAYENNRIDYHFQLVHWFMNINQLLKRLSDAKRTSILVSHLEDIYTKDALTGLYNKHGYLHRETLLLQEAAENQSTVTCFLFDLNRLKYINDHYGHNEGDFAIQVIGHALSSVTRSTDICARFSSDEFYLLTMDYTKEDADELLTRVYKYLDNYNKISHKEYKISASGGYAQSTPGASLAKEDVKALFSKADEHMYQQKQIFHQDLDK